MTASPTTLTDPLPDSDPSLPDGVRLVEGLRGVRTTTRREQRAQRVGAVVVSILPLLGLATAVVSLWGWGISGRDVALMVGFHVFTVLGITVGYHRLFTHQAFRAPRAVRVALAVAGTMAAQGNVIGWVATHRRHHAYADQPGDPHSPHLAEAPGIRGQLQGLWHAHIGWIYRAQGTVATTWAPDLLADPAIVRVDGLFPHLVAVSIILPGILGGVLSGTLAGAVTGLVWGGFVRLFLVHHMTWSINSICHFFGRRPFESHDESTNNWPLSIVSLGESWHNNHHAFPASAKHGLLRGQVDLSWLFIRTLSAVRLASDIKLPTPGQLARKRRVQEQTG